MKKQLGILFLTFIGLSTFAQSQNLFKINNNGVTKEEFLRMYTKNLSSQKLNFSSEAINEYIKLYARFKMKVAEANEKQIDTLHNISSDISSYRQQLAKTYLTDKEVTNKLVKEAYDRSKIDVRVAHILITLPRGTEDTTASYKKIDSIYNVINSGAMTFEKAANAFSEDKQSGVNGGDIGFITTLQIVYPFENVAYNTSKGKLSKPFRTIYGYHIIKKLDERVARGEIQVAQIMTQVQKSEGAEGERKALEKITEAIKELKAGKNFEAMVEKYSEDKFSISSKGVLPIFGVGRMVEDYENVAFGLKKPGDFTSTPVKTNNGYHVIKLIQKIPVKPFDSVSRELTKRVEKDGRIEAAKEEFTAKIKKKLNFKENPTALTELINAIPDSTLTNGKFKPEEYARMNKTLFSMNNNNITQADFINYFSNFSKGRIFGTKNDALRSLYKNYTDKTVMDFQESQLENENTEFKNLLTEYREGVMIFELTDQMVWSKAARDTSGLKKYFESHKENYKWEPSFTGVVFKAQNEDAAKVLIKELNKEKRPTAQEIVKAVNGDGPQNKANFEEGKFEQSRFKFDKPLQEGKYMPMIKNTDGSYTIVLVDNVYNQATPKTLDEAKGYVISEYQEYLEKQWHNELDAKYPYSIDQKVLKTIIK